MSLWKVARVVKLLGRAAGGRMGLPHHPGQCSPPPRICTARAGQDDSSLRSVTQAAAEVPARASSTSATGFIGLEGTWTAHEDAYDVLLELTALQHRQCALTEAC